MARFSTVGVALTSLLAKLRCVFTACSFPAACTGVAASLACAAGVARSAAMSKPGLQARAAAQAGAHVDINVHVTTGGAAAASASAQPNVQRPESRQHNIASFFGKRTAPTGSEPETVGAAGRERPKLRPRSRRARRPWSRKGKTCATALPLAFQCVLVRHLMFNRDVINQFYFFNFNFLRRLRLRDPACSGAT